MSRWAEMQLRGMRRAVRAAITHASQAIDSTTPQAAEVSAIRADLRKALARINRAIQREADHNARRQPEGAGQPAV